MIDTARTFEFPGHLQVAVISNRAENALRKYQLKIFGERDKRAVVNAIDYVSGVFSFSDFLESMSMKGYSSEEARNHHLTIDTLKRKMGIDLSGKALRKFLLSIRQTLVAVREGGIVAGNKLESAVGYFHNLCENCLDEGGREYTERIARAYSH